MTVAKIITLLGNAGDEVNYTCANQNAIAKGELLWLTDPVTVSGAATFGGGKPAAGIAAHEKKASDGSTTIGVYTNGIFDIVSGDHVIYAGEYVKISGQNVVEKSFVAADWVSGQFLGKALEDSNGSGETIAVKVNT